MPIKDPNIEPNTRIEELDLLRALAITMVIVHHLGRGILKGFIPSLFCEAWTGVDLFFLISGYLVTRAFSQWVAHAGVDSDLKTRSQLAFRYCLRRLFRIIPPAWLWSAIPVVASLYLNQSGVFGAPSEVFSEFMAVLKFQYNYFTVASGIGHINHFWSLAVEEHYYILLPLFLLIIPSKGARVMGLLFVAISCEIMRITARRSGYNFGGILFLTHFRADALAFGSILGLLVDRIKEVTLSLSSKTWRWFRLIAVLSIVFLWIGPSILSRSQVIYFGFSIFALISAFLVGLASTGRGLFRFPRFLSRPFVEVGKRSYSLYLIHVPLLGLAAEIRFRTLGMAAAAEWESWIPALVELGIYLLALAVLTELNYRVVEHPLIQLIRSRFREPAFRGETKALSLG